MNTHNKGALAAAVAAEVAWEEATMLLEAEIDLLAADAAAQGESADRLLSAMRDKLAWYRRELVAAAARRQEAEKLAGGWPADWD